MNRENNEISRSQALIRSLIFSALTVLKENGGQMLSRDVIAEVGRKVRLDAWALERYAKTGYVRWESLLHFHSIASVKAGFLVKKQGTWFLTPEGEAALSKGENQFFEETTQAYIDWSRSRSRESVEVSAIASGADVSSVDARKTLEQTEEVAFERIEDFINQLNPYEFQDLAAALLRGMGYFTPFIAPAGKDGGVDIVAYRDPLGTTSPRMKVQIKHREQSASVSELRALMGLLQKDGDVGIFISSGGFTPDAKITARTSHVHVELIDSGRFISLWQDFYPKLTDEDKARLPLTPIYFLTPQA